MILGISITEDMVYLSTDTDNEVVSVPFVILRNTENNSWHIGGKAYELSILNKGIIVDKLLYMVENNSFITISNQQYVAQNLLDYFFRELLMQYETPEYVTVSVYKNDIAILKAINNSLVTILGDDKVHITSHSESFVHYVLNKAPEYLDKTIGLIDFTNKSLTYYELNHKKTRSDKNVYMVDKINHPPISKDMLNDKTGDMICNNLLTEFIKEVSKDKEYSCILLSGIGLDNYTKYIDFINFAIKLCPHVIQEIKLFAIGSLYMAKSHVENNIDQSFYITDMRTSHAIKLKVDNKEYEQKTICNIGEEWFYKNNIFNIIVDNDNELVFKIEDYNKNRLPDIVHKIDEKLVNRKDKTNMLSLHLTFTQQNIFLIDIKDEGFGEFYDKTGVSSICEGIL